MIQLPLALVRFGRLTCSVYTSFPDRIFSGAMLGSNLLTSAGPRLLLDGSYGAIGFRFSPPARLPDGVIPPLPARGAAPLMLTAAGREPPLAPPAVFATPEDADRPPPFSPAPAAAPAVAPGVPGFAPSGEIEIRAARFPSGTLTWGAGGAGDAESAIRRRRPASPWSAAAPISGAGPASAPVACRRATAVDMASSEILGRAMDAGDGAMLMGPAFFSVFETSGATASATARCRKRGAAAVGASSRCGRFRLASDHSTIFGRGVTILGGAGGASG